MPRYDHCHNTWEPINNLDGCQELVQAYEEQAELDLELEEREEDQEVQLPEPIFFY